MLAYVCVCLSWGQIVAAVLNNFEFRLLVLPRSAAHGGKKKVERKRSSFQWNAKCFFAALCTTSHGRAESFVYLLSALPTHTHTLSLTHSHVWWHCQATLKTFAKPIKSKAEQRSRSAVTTKSKLRSAQLRASLRRRASLLLLHCNPVNRARHSQWAALSRS